MTTIYLIRHAMSSGNDGGYYCGHMDVPLSAEGYSQTEKLAERFDNVRIDAVYSSPLLRAYETAKAVNRSHRLDIALRYSLIELYAGDFQGRTFEEIDRVYHAEYECYKNDPGSFCAPEGESTAQLRERSLNAIREIAAENPGRTVAVVSHGDFIRSYTCGALGLPLGELKNVAHNHNTGVTRIDYDEQLCPKVVFRDDCSHIPELEGKEVLL